MLSLVGEPSRSVFLTVFDRASVIRELIREPVIQELIREPVIRELIREPVIRELIRGLTCGGD